MLFADFTICFRHRDISAEEIRNHYSHIAIVIRTLDAAIDVPHYDILLNVARIEILANLVNRVIPVHELIEDHRKDVTTVVGKIFMLVGQKNKCLSECVDFLAFLQASLFDVTEPEVEEIARLVLDDKSHLVFVFELFAHSCLLNVLNEEMNALVEIWLFFLQELLNNLLSTFASNITDHFQEVAHESHCGWNFDSLFWCLFDSTILIFQSLQNVIHVVKDKLIIFVASKNLNVFLIREQEFITVISDVTHEFQTTLKFLYFVVDLIILEFVEK